MQRWEHCSIKHTSGNGLIYCYYPADGSDPNWIQLHPDPTRQDVNYYQVWQLALRDAGSSGWELVDIVPVDEIYENWYFKRPV